MKKERTIIGYVSNVLKIGSLELEWSWGQNGVEGRRGECRRGLGFSLLLVNGHF